MILLDSARYAHLRRGIEAGLIAGVPQVLITKAEEKLFLPPDEDADLGPRLISRLADWAREPLPEDMKWLAASAFHFGYAAAWGAAYSALYQRRPMKPWLGGLLLGGVIYGISFPAWGVAVRAGVERKPRQRSWRMEAVLATAAFSFGLGTALIYDRGPRRTVRERLRARWLEAKS